MVIMTYFSQTMMDTSTIIKMMVHSSGRVSDILLQLGREYITHIRIAVGDDFVSQILMKMVIMIY